MADLQQQLEATPVAGLDWADHSLLDAVLVLLRLLGVPKSREVLASNISPAGLQNPGDYETALQGLGFSTAQLDLPMASLASAGLPCVALLADGQAVTVVEANQQQVVVMQAGRTGRRTLSCEVFAAHYQGRLLHLRPPLASGDTRADEFIQAPHRGWFWPVMWRYRRYYLEAMALAGIINILTLASVIFTLTVYDRVLPNQSYVTLWSLAAGVVAAMVIEFFAKTARTWVLDSAGKKVDLVLGDAIFDQVLKTRLEFRTQSSGAFANIFKEFEQVRGFVTSASLVAIADLPFSLFFIGITYLVAGPLALVPLAAFLLVSLMALVLQWPLAALAREGLRHSSVRHGAVIESLEGLETVKAARAEARMRARYDVASEVIAQTGVKSASLSGITLNGTMLVQQLATVVLLVWGVYLVAAGQVTAGAIIAAVQLTSRSLAPLTNLTSLAMRFQHVKSAMGSLNRIMSQPVDRDANRQYLSGTHWQGALELRQASFSYRKDEPPVIRQLDISIRRGEKVAIIGRMGSGKSTLLRLLAGLYQPQQGSLMLDGVDCAQIEPADVRSTVLLLPQEGRLFHGSLRENLVLSNPSATDEEILRIAAWSGVQEIAARHPRAFERLVGERGDTLSAGQRQAIAITRALLAHPKVYLLDEPTSAMDQASESAVMQGLLAEIGDATLVMVTHKASLLAFVDRLIVVDNGFVVADGPKQAVIQAINEGHVKAA